MTPLQIIPGVELSDQQRVQAFDVLYEGFEQKIHRLFLMTDCKAKARRMLPSLLDFSHSLAAVEEGAVQGILFMNRGSHRSFRFDAALGRKEFGRWGVFLRRINYWLIKERACQPDQIHLQALCVRGDLRGRGIGSRLIEAVRAHAAEQRCKKLTLKVVDSNPAARRLYQRHGFTILKSARTWPFTTRAGFNGYDYMVKQVTAEPAGQR